MAESPPVVSGRQFVFGDFHMDVARYRLRCGQREVPLRPKSWDVLRYLVERPGLLVTKEAFHRDVWSETTVSDDTLTKSIAELRRALGDTRTTPRFIETVHGRGFRFVAEVREVGADPPSGTVATEPTPGALGGDPAYRFVGRAPELDQLHECLRKARQGERQLALITGEAGIGKTTLCEEFLRALSTPSTNVHVLRGQCIQQHGQREAYMPMLEALERVFGSSEGATLIPLFQRIAPCWYVQIPWLLSEGEPKGFQAAMMTAPPERMLREIGAFLEAAASRSTIVLLLEDLHWSDHATADLLLYLAQRPGAARLLIIGTFRPAEASTSEHPIREVRQTLRARRRCVDLPLDYLSREDVSEYLERRFGHELRALAPLIHERTDGNPLFVVAVVEELIRRGQLKRADRGWAMSAPVDRLKLTVPDGLLEMVTTQFQSLSPDERSILEVASVVGLSFVPGTVARSVGRDAEEVDGVAQRLARARLFLDPAVTSGSRGPAARYGFAHALHHQAIYEQIPPLRRQRLHLSVAEALESSAGERVSEIASELSVHFEQGGDELRAASYLGICVTRAQERQAPSEAIACAELGLDLLARLPGSPERRERELELRLRLGVSLCLTRGYSSAAVRDNYDRARTLCTKEGHGRQLFEIVHAVWYAQMTGFRLDDARASIEELGRIAEGQTDPEFRLRVELARGRTEYWAGHFGVAARILTQLLETNTDQAIEHHPQTYGIAPMVAAYGQGSHALWFIGRPDQARAWGRTCVASAEGSREPFALASALTHSSFLELLCGNEEGAAVFAERALKVSSDHSVAIFVPMSRFLAGAAQAGRGKFEEGLAVMLPALVEHREVVGSLITDILLGLLAAAYARAGRWDDGLAKVEEGLELGAEAGEHVFAAELWRIKGELLLGKAQMTGRRKAEAHGLLEAARHCIERALEVAQGQEARSLELRGAMSLVRLLGRSDGSREARERLRSLLASFTEGLDTRDVRDATTLLGDTPRQRS